MTIIGKSALAALAAVAIAASASGAQAQSKTMRQQLIGNWAVVSAVVTQGDVKREVFGANPKGLLILERDGRFVQFLLASGLPKFASNSRDTGTPEENKEIVTKSLAFYGTWTVNETDRTVDLMVEASSYPNYDGRDLKRLVTTLTAAELVWTNPTPSQGAGTGQVAWKRVK
ncbi:MAG TPA: lipocalin-like domain-containing protein [Stellaceae bacterium]|jgi:hypothetical protein|nr:lipocalin-like domain-containing protein [Stellaceae bacterium]